MKPRQPDCTSAMLRWVMPRVPNPADKFWKMRESQSRFSAHPRRWGFFIGQIQFRNADPLINLMRGFLFLNCELRVNDIDFHLRNIHPMMCKTMLTSQFALL